MPLDYRIDKSLGLLLLTGRGPIQAEDIDACFERLLADPDYSAVRKELADFREASFSFQPDDVKKLAKSTRERPLETQIERRAIVVVSELQYGLARMFSQLVAPSGQEVQPFRDINEARRWLDGDKGGEGT
jgi:hypothetical protein